MRKDQSPASGRPTRTAGRDFFIMNEFRNPFIKLNNKKTNSNIYTLFIYIYMVVGRLFFIVLSVQQGFRFFERLEKRFSETAHDRRAQRAINRNAVLAALQAALLQMFQRW